MELLNLLIILFIGGAIAWVGEYFSKGLSRWISLLFIAIAAASLLEMLSNIPAPTFLKDPVTKDPTTWLVHGKADWIPRFGISFELALDGLSLLLVVLTLFLGAVSVIASWDEIDKHQGFFQANIMWTLTGVIGVFVALDLILFFLFWEVMLVPMYLLIAIWGHEDKAKAAMKFFIFTQVSGLLMLLAMITLAIFVKNTNGYWSFSYFDLLDNNIAGSLATFIMLGFFIGFTVKLPGFPFHTWLPDAHTQAPTAGSVILAGILLKTGAYGLIRFTVPLFPEASIAFAPIAILLGASGVIYGAILAFGQTDFKRLVAYSSVSHMGFVLLGVFAWNALAIQGAVMQLVAHGLSTAALFMIAGALQHRLHTRDLQKMGGLWQSMPRMGALAMFFIAASLGLPGMGNFIAEFLVLAGLFQVYPWLAVVSSAGLITGAIYSLKLIQESFQGVPDETLTPPDFSVLAMIAMIAMLIGLIVLGIFPQLVLDISQPVINTLTSEISL